MAMRIGGAHIDHYVPYEGQWRHASTGEPLQVGAEVTLWTDMGGSVCAVDPVTRTATTTPKVFHVTAIDGTNVSLSPRLDDAPVR